MENMSLSDIAAVTRGNDDGDGWGGNGAWWIIVLFLFMFGAGWNRGGGANGEPVTEAGLCNAMNFNNLENAVGRLSDQNTQQTMQLGNGICNLGYELQGNIGQLGKEVALGQANLQMQASNNAAAINANTTAAVQKVLDAIQQDKIGALQGQVNQLQLQSALCGVVRYPNSTTFTAGYNPYFNANTCGCGTTF